MKTAKPLHPKIMTKPICMLCRGRAVKALTRLGQGSVCCEKGHIWHTCPVHGSIVLGKPAHREDRCSCNQPNIYDRGGS